MRRTAPGRSDRRLPLPFQGASHRNSWNAPYRPGGTCGACSGQDLLEVAHGSYERMERRSGPRARNAGGRSFQWLDPARADSGQGSLPASLQARRLDRNCWNTVCKTSGKTMCHIADRLSYNQGSNTFSNIAELHTMEMFGNCQPARGLPEGRATRGETCPSMAALPRPCFTLLRPRMGIIWPKQSREDFLRPFLNSAIRDDRVAYPGGGAPVSCDGGRPTETLGTLTVDLKGPAGPVWARTSMRGGSREFRKNGNIGVRPTARAFYGLIL